MVNIREQKQWMTYEGSNICYKLYQHPTDKQKPYMIFIHGFLSSQYSFRKMIPKLIETFNIVTIDIPPFGDSDRVKSFHFSYSNYAKMIVHFMDIHSIPRAFLTGHSMGGQVALTCAYQYPNRIEQVYLLAPSSYLVKADRLTYFLSWLPFFPSLLKKLFHRKGVYQILRQGMYNQDLITKKMIATYAKPFLDNKIYLCLTKMIRDREGDLDRQHLNKITTKCFLFWGKQDDILPIAIGYQLLKDLPHAELLAFDQAGHLLPEEIPATICRSILSTYR
ncbi:alpha/beta fold hydrolase [Radiobacillus sp. PE A8.2]|uniref:alpha/beta fold hydrolase n=1 Tax=Radiobacillus sp. PE A8.2 TaxID=3380349 RepID=UPI00388EBBB1